MSNILFITTQYRSGERIYPVIPYLSKDHNVDLLKIYHMHPTNGKWGGDIDMRIKFNIKYNQYFKNVYSSINEIEFEKYDLILADDCRSQSGLSEIYNRRKCLMIGNSHGNNRYGYPIINHKKCFDGCFVFGEKELTQSHLIPGGIPSNDKLKEYENLPKKHILIITNFLGNKPTFTDQFGFKFLPFDEVFFEKLKIKDIQNYYSKEVVIKLKSREKIDVKESIDYVHKIIPDDVNYKVIIDTEDDNLLIAESECVIGHPSTMMLKPLQLGIPTAMIKGYGYGDEDNCIFGDSKNLVELDYEKIMTVLKLEKDIQFIKRTIQGGENFNSIQYYLDYITQILEK